MATGMRTVAIGAALAAAIAQAAAAQTLLLGQPGQEGGLPGRMMDVTVSYAAAGPRHVVTARFAPRDGGAGFGAMLSLGPGEVAAFTPPGREDEVYRFSRDGAALIVTVERASRLRLAGRR